METGKLFLKLTDSWSLVGSRDVLCFGLHYFVVETAGLGGELLRGVTFVGECGAKNSSWILRARASILDIISFVSYSTFDFSRKMPLDTSLSVRLSAASAKMFRRSCNFLIFSWSSVCRRGLRA